MSKLRIVLADDHTIVREGVKSLINQQLDMEVVGEADDGDGVLRRVKECEPDLVVMDISMPGLNGAQATERLRHTLPAPKVLVLTAFEDKSYLRQLLAAGASGYLLKRAAANELVHAIRTVASGGVYIDPTLAGKVVNGFVRQRAGDGTQAPESALSEREADVLRLLARGLTYKEVAAQLGIGVKTVETYKARLMEKLELRSRAEIIRYAVRQGWLQDD